MYSTLSANFIGRVRREKLNGRDHLVAPLTLIVPGVLNGSRGPLYYPSEELAKDPSAWNHMPIVVNHPQDYGYSGSARSPDVLNRYGIGVVLRARHNGKLTAEGWFDVDRTRDIDSRILNALESGRPIELSTGLYTDNEPSRGTFNGRKYTHIARNYRPDHLAILPDSEGACSIKDGCGVLMNEGLTDYEIEWVLNKAKELQRSPAYLDEDDILPLPSISWAENSKQQCGCKAAPQTDDDVLPLPTMNWS